MPARKPYKRGQTEPFIISRSRIEEHIRCPRCSVLNLRFGVKTPSGPPFNLNKAVDNLLKKEFDLHRAAGTVHPLVAAAGLDLVPFKHPDMDMWRENFKGARTTLKDFEVFGAVDDIWVDREGTLFIVDYKATSKTKAVTEVGYDGFHLSYRRQLEMYQWLFRRLGFTVSNTGYWLYCTATQKEPTFDATLHFECNLIPFDGSDVWIEGVLAQMKTDLDAAELPPAGGDCDFCTYFSTRTAALIN